jgi:hypothetical protein
MKPKRLRGFGPPSWRHVVTLAVVATVAFAAGLSMRARAKAPSGRYKMLNGAVTDTKTGLVWEAATTGVNAGEAKTHCAGLTSTLGGVGWRIPTIKELESLVDETVTSGAAIDPVFLDAPSQWFESSTPSTTAPTTDGWYLDAGTGVTHIFTRTSLSAYARCVR